MMKRKFFAIALVGTFLLSGVMGNLSVRANELSLGQELTEETVIAGEEPILPYLRIKVLSPNGGELWNRNEIQTIRWTWTVVKPSKIDGDVDGDCDVDEDDLDLLKASYGKKKGESDYNPNADFDGNGAIDHNDLKILARNYGKTCMNGNGLGIPEIYPEMKASIDLSEKMNLIPECISGEICPESETRTVFMKHIATVDLFDGIYSWKITDDIPNGENYIIRISLGIPIPSPLETERVEPIEVEKDIAPVPSPYYGIWDESDEPFEITGKIYPEPPTLGEVIEILEKMVGELQRAIALLKKMSG